MQHVLRVVKNLTAAIIIFSGAGLASASVGSDIHSAHSSCSGCVILWLNIEDYSSFWLNLKDFSSNWLNI